MSGQGPTYHYEEPPKLPGKNELILSNLIKCFQEASPPLCMELPTARITRSTLTRQLLTLSYQDKILSIVLTQAESQVRFTVQVQCKQSLLQPGECLHHITCKVTKCLHEYFIHYYSKSKCFFHFALYLVFLVAE